MPAEKWEYLSIWLNAAASAADSAYLQTHFPGVHQADYSPMALIPELNRYGAEGWELVSVQPHVRGKNDDVMAPAGQPLTMSGTAWTHSYLCVFKRRLG
jgi:hypothetical protein